MATLEMQYRADPKGGKRLSALGFGCMRLPGSAEQREQLIVSAVEAGINYFDTAYLYPGSEAALGGILKKHGLRDKVYIADKLPHFKCKIGGDFERLFKESLDRLQTDYIDYYLIHNIGSREAWARLEGIGVREWIAEKKERGAIGQIGFSFHGKAGDFVPLLDAYDWDFSLIQYNYMNENYQAGTAGLEALHARGLAAIIMEPLLGGNLAQKLPAKARELFEQTVSGRSPAAWALKWLWDKPEVTVVLSGMKAMEQLTENIETVCDTPAGSLTQEERAVFGKVHEAIAGVYKIPCTGCDYCMPCPRGVNIPGCFTSYNTSDAMGWIAGISQYINATAILETGASGCTGCGACVKKCPQGIKILDRLKDVRRRLEPLPIRGAMAVARRFIK